ncbi:ABC transporter substrate-binding protein [Halobaculum sp. WSA2]|uniref:ABC transporter substrate-binding protein n=1 Tax=Halobaculum saliterrae TaxID=2073113 RepID=A0A6B0SZP7_9EURY|nr:ABC transporter substrate-binding protein [Halobaculum saliterrae]MXR41450.1 ABC transporter substrate-binding protein [Halobaculum saliterrae]
MTDSTEGSGPSRREFARLGGAVVAGGLLAGCTGESDERSTESEAATGTATASTTEATPEETTAASDEFAVSMAPVGEVSFESVPSSVSVYSLLYADMAVAYGAGDAVNSLGFDAAAGGNTLDAYYERLDGVSFDYGDLTQLNTGSGEIRVEKELFYELDSDLHLMDPALLDSFDGWNRADVEEVTGNVAPFFGNTYSRTHGEPPEEWRDDYEYYTLWDIAERVSRVFGASDRYEELAAVREGMIDRIQSDLPPESERPSVASVIFVDGTFYPSQINADGFANAHVRPLGAVDAFAGTDAGFGTTYDYETLLEVDPDVILHQYGIASYYDVASIRETIAGDPVGGELTAIENGRFYPSGTPVQGPLMNLFQLEMTAKQLYPEQFGEWPEYEHGGPYPEIPEGERLFDRQRVAEAVAGEE